MFHKKSFQFLNLSHRCLQHDSASKPSNVIAQDVGVVNTVVANSGVKKDNKRNSMVPQESLDSHQSSVPEEKKVAELKSHSGFQLHVHLKQVVISHNLLSCN